MTPIVYAYRDPLPSSRPADPPKKMGFDFDPNATVRVLDVLDPPTDAETPDSRHGRFRVRRGGDVAVAPTEPFVDHAYLTRMKIRRVRDYLLTNSRKLSDERLVALYDLAKAMQAIIDLSEAPRA